MKKARADANFFSAAVKKIRKMKERAEFGFNTGSEGRESGWI